MLKNAARCCAALSRLSPTVATSPALRRVSVLVQCGLEDVHSRLPNVLPLPASPSTSSPVSISFISCGLFHSAAVTSAGAVLFPLHVRNCAALLILRALTLSSHNSCTVCGA